MLVTEQLPEKLRDRYAGATKVKDVKVEFREDSSEQPALFVILVLSDPPANNETWPIDDLWEIRRFAQQAMDDLTERWEPNWETPWFVSFEPENPELLTDDDELPLADN